MIVMIEKLYGTYEFPVRKHMILEIEQKIILSKNLQLFTM